MSDDLCLAHVAARLHTSHKRLGKVAATLGIEGRYENRPTGGRWRMFTPGEVRQLAAGLEARKEQYAMWQAKKQQADDYDARRAVILCWVLGLTVAEAAKRVRKSQRLVRWVLAHEPPYNGLPGATCQVCADDVLLETHARCWACGILLGPEHGDAGGRREGWAGPLCRACADPKPALEYVSVIACPAVHKGRVARPRRLGGDG